MFAEWFRTTPDFRCRFSKLRRIIGSTAPCIASSRRNAPAWWANRDECARRMCELCSHERHPTDEPAVAKNGSSLQDVQLIHMLATDERFLRTRTGMNRSHVLSQVVHEDRGNDAPGTSIDRRCLMSRLGHRLRGRRQRRPCKSPGCFCCGVAIELFDHRG